ncbi:MAG: type III-B CRISPR-associated protein Cas10/Cmr2, partial [Thermoproteota archaeon]
MNLSEVKLMPNLREYFLLKTAALMRYPPTKSWIEAGFHRAPEHPDRIMDKEASAYEREAYQMLKEIIKATPLDGSHEYIKHSIVEDAGRYAAEFNKGLLEVLFKDEAETPPVKKIILKNVFDTRATFDLTNINVDWEKIKKNFIQCLNEFLRATSQDDTARLAWHVLYSAYELAWINFGGPSSPADTRAPTYTIFDHNYATATLINWLAAGGEGLKGFLVLIDLAGIHPFISASRKLRDLWASSFLVSALAWGIIWPFIEKLGPDVLLLPTARFNPFYYHSLQKLLTDFKLNDVAEKLGNFTRELGFYDPEWGCPRYAVMPATVTLILPDVKILKEAGLLNQMSNERNRRDLIKEFIKRRYIEIWGNLIKKIEEIEVNGALKKLIEQLRKDIEFFDIRKVPPLSIRVKVAEISGKTIVIDCFHVKVDEERDLYDRAMRLLGKIHRREAFLKVEPYVKLNLTELTEEIYREDSAFGYPSKSERGYDYCTVCGSLPATVILPSDKEYQKTFGLDAKEAGELKILFSPGERLCPYCFIKRLISIKPNILEVLVGKCELDVSFPSISDIATFEFKAQSIKKALEDQSYREKLIKAVVKGIIKRRKRPLWKGQRMLLGEIERSGLKEEEKAVLKEFVLVEAESLYMTAEKRLSEEWIELWRRAEIEEPRCYYAIIKADGDGIGRLLTEGDLTELAIPDVRRYLVDTYEGELKELVSKVMEGDLKRATKIAENLGVMEAESKVKEFGAALRNVVESGKIILSPTFHIAMSRALMMTALRDVRMVENENGVVIYAGGDDLLAVVPLVNALRLIRDTRKSFNVGDERPIGFFKQKDFYLVPTLVSIGRSYVLYEAHYMYPLYAVIEDAERRLEEEAKKSLWSISSEELKKDTLTIVYSPRGGAKTIHLPLKTSKDAHILNELA